MAKAKVPQRGKTPRVTGAASTKAAKPIAKISAAVALRETRESAAPKTTAAHASAGPRIVTDNMSTRFGGRDLGRVGIAVFALSAGLLIGWGVTGSWEPTAQTPVAVTTAKPAASVEITGSVVTTAKSSLEAVANSDAKASHNIVADTVAVIAKPAAGSDASASLPIIPHWTLLEVQNRPRGIRALIEGHDEIYRVRVGSSLQGAGRVTDIRETDGRWMLVTTQGLVVPKP